MKDKFFKTEENTVFLTFFLQNKATKIPQERVKSPCLAKMKFG